MRSRHGQRQRVLDRRTQAFAGGGLGGAHSVLFGERIAHDDIEAAAMDDRSGRRTDPSTLNPRSAPAPTLPVQKYGASQLNVGALRVLGG